MKKLLSVLLFVLLGFLTSLNAKVKTVKTKDGLVVKFYLDNKKSRLAIDSDYMEMGVITKFGDSVVFNSYQMVGAPVPNNILKSQNGPLHSAFLLLSAGDSITITTKIDSLIKDETKMPPFVKKGDNAIFAIKVYSVKSMEEVKAEKMREQNNQIISDDSILNAFFKSQNIKPKKMQCGVYYTTQKPGEGTFPSKGQSITANYTGKLLDGTIFDSNVDSNFNHVEPFSFKVGENMVIAGWDKGFQELRVGEKATLYIPSAMAYGTRGAGKDIGPNACLIFEVELLDAK